MHISHQLYIKILSYYEPAPPEAGGILGQAKENLCAYYHDASPQSAKSSIYSPNIQKINQMLCSWAKHGIELAGIVHSHPKNQFLLSDDDLIFAQQIFIINSHLTSLYFPLILDGNKMISYRINRVNGALVLHKEPILFKEDKQMEKIKACKLKSGILCGYNCANGCIYWDPYRKDSNGRQYCSWYGHYYYPRERQGCLSFKN